MDFFAGLAEGKPTIPAFKPIDVQAEQAKAIQGNITALPEAEKLAAGVNSFNQQQIEMMLRQAIPMYDELKKASSSHIDSMLKGELPEDVVQSVQSGAAAKAFGGGFAGSGMHGALTSRDLGITSLSLSERGLSSAESWMKTVAALESPGFFDVSKMFVNPQLQIATDVEERNAQFQHDYISNLNDWQHSIGYLWGQDMRNTGETIKSLLSSYLGGMGGGCWVAREVFGRRNPRWLLFRHWLYIKAPRWLRALYLRHGARFAEFLADKPRIKALIRRWMNSRIRGLCGSL